MHTVVLLGLSITLTSPTYSIATMLCMLSLLGLSIALALLTHIISTRTVIPLGLSVALMLPMHLSIMRITPARPERTTLTLPST